MTDKASFIAAAQAAAFETEDNRTIIHCFGGGMGCDWDLDAVLREIEGADHVEWVNGFAGHDLLTQTGMRRRAFAVSRPEGN